MQNGIGTVYLLHFDRPYKHARHYLGWTQNFFARLDRHLAGNGARLIEVITAAGITFTLARLWPNATRALERRLKDQHNTPRLCPICNQALALPLPLLEQPFIPF